MLLELILGLAPWLAGQVAGGKAEAVTRIGAQIFKDVLGTDDPAAIGAALADPANAEAVKTRLELLRTQVEAQSQLALAETAKGDWWNSWRPAFAWIMVSAIATKLLVSPGLEAAIGVPIKVDTELLKEVAGWWMAIYMGGHTVKFGVGQLADALKVRFAK